MIILKNNYYFSLNHQMLYEASHSEIKLLNMPLKTKTKYPNHKSE
jgi:hypothetical protein